MRLAYFDCFSGASGDMILGSLIDAGVRVREVESRLRFLNLGSWKLLAARVKRGSFMGTLARVEAGPGFSAKGLLRRITGRRRLAGADQKVFEAGRRILLGIIGAEGKVHGVKARHVHLHEIEDLDTVVDVFGSLVALKLLGIGKVYASEIAVGSGCISAAHGVLPVPAPGTAELLVGRKIRIGGAHGELATPTGAAILTGVAEHGEPPVFELEKTGYGAGSRDFGGTPNLLRVLVGEARETDGLEREEIWELAANVDDMSPQLVDAFLDRAYEAGALEAWTIPALMKRQRPGFEIRVLAPPRRANEVTRAFLEETATLGVRIARLERVKLGRRFERLRTPWGEVRVKLAGEGAAFHAIPEYLEVKRLANRRGVPVRLLMEGIKALCLKRFGRAHLRGGN